MKFRVRIYNFAGHDLAPKDSNGFSDPYIVGDFDNFKRFKTPVLERNLNPRWDFELEFNYQTKYWKKMNCKNFVLSVMDKDRWTRNDLIGKCHVDLHTLATGPVEHELTLLKDKTPQGTLSFCVEMVQVPRVTAVFEGLQVTGLPLVEGVPPNPVLHIEHSLESNRHHVETKVQRSTTNPEWTAVPHLEFETELQQFMDTSLMIQVLHHSHGDDLPIGTLKLELQDLHAFEDGVPCPFRLALDLHGGFRVSGAQPLIEGSVYFLNLPQFAQMIGGKHTDVAIVGGEPFHPLVQRPEVRMVAVGADEATQPRSGAYLGRPEKRASAGEARMFSGAAPASAPTVPLCTNCNRPVEPGQPLCLECLGHRGAKTLTRVLSNSSDEVLPEGWERRWDDRTGHWVYVDHATRSTSWQAPPGTVNPVVPSPAARTPPPQPSAPSAPAYYGAQPQSRPQPQQWQPPPQPQQPPRQQPQAGPRFFGGGSSAPSRPPAQPQPQSRPRSQPGSSVPFFGGS